MNAEQSSPSWLSLGIEIVRLFPWFVGTVLLVIIARKVSKWGKCRVVRDAVNPTPKHEEDVKANVRELLMKELDADSANAIMDDLENEKVESAAIAEKYPNLIQIDVVYEKAKGNKVQRTVEVAAKSRAGTMRVTTAKRLYDYDFTPADVREEMIRRNVAKVAKLRYRAKGK